MSVLSGSFSLYYERYWRLDSGFRAASYVMEYGLMTPGGAGDLGLGNCRGLHRLRAPVGSII